MNRTGPQVNNKQKSMSDASQGGLLTDDRLSFCDPGGFFPDALEQRDQRGGDEIFPEQYFAAFTAGILANDFHDGIELIRQTEALRLPTSSDATANGCLQIVRHILPKVSSFPGRLAVA
jgi:hypothetical protein